MTPLNTEEAARKAKRAEYYRKWREANTEKLAASGKKYYAANREKFTERSKKYYADNREKFKARNNKWREDNPEKAAAGKKKWSEDNREILRERSNAAYAADPQKRRDQARARRAANPQKHLSISRASTQKRRARIKGAAGWDYATVKKIQARLDMFGGKCWICGGEATAMDHVKPISKGGAHFPSNLRPACTTCNSSKLAKWPYPTTTNQETRYEAD